MIEDSPAMRSLIGEMLENLNFLTKYAENGREGLNILDDEQVSLIFLDLEMPVMDGLTFLSEYRKVDLRTPIIICSWTNKMELIVEALKLGANEYIIKPFDESILVSKLESIVHRTSS